MSTVVHPTARTSKAAVQKRLRDWERRIRALFRSVEEWSVEEWGRESLVWGKREQLHEYLMRQAGIPPRELPTLEVRTGKRNVMFTPSCLWIIGANGRIDVSVGDRPYTLVDMGATDDKTSDWQISNPDLRIVLEPFTRAVFLRLARTGR